jgi:hypothetical protein
MSGCAETAMRKPALPVNQLLQRQFEVLPSGWIFPGSVDESEIMTDSDATWGAWTVWVVFNRKDPREGGITTEVHAFRNRRLAKRTRWPSPSISLEPTDWSYMPPGADEFIVECDEPQNHQDQYCLFSVLYEGYRIILRISINEYMTVENVNELLNVTDEFMQEYLANSTIVQGAQWERITPNAPEILR